LDSATFESGKALLVAQVIDALAQDCCKPMPGNELHHLSEISCTLVEPPGAGWFSTKKVATTTERFHFRWNPTPSGIFLVE
jgi:hypothetical protein